MPRGRDILGRRLIGNSSLRHRSDPDVKFGSWRHPGEPPMSHRILKKQVLNLLQSESIPAMLAAVCRWPSRQVVNPLIGCLYHIDDTVRWHAVSAMGAVVSKLAAEEMESARVVMRRLMWNLNDESGGIGWGSPEALGEIMARQGALAGEYAPILISYLDPQGNYLEHNELQKGVLWGLGRLAHSRPLLAAPAARLLPPFLSSPDATLRGLALWASEAVPSELSDVWVKTLRTDQSTFTLYLDGRFTRLTIAELANRATGIEMDSV